MRRIPFSLFLIFWGIPLFAGANHPFLATARLVLSNLYEVYGDRQHPPPGISIVQDGKGPRYWMKSDVIVLDERTIQVCRSFGKDSLSALAFVLGHEFAHSLQEQVRNAEIEFSYLAFHKSPDSDLAKEELADIHGIFNAYLAGYRTTWILPEFLDRLYQAYSLADQLPDYPSLAERREMSKKVVALVDTLSRVYDAANFLSALGQYDLAAASYEYILRYYPGREIYNNLGVNLALHAMQYSEKSPDLFLLPFEQDWQTRLRKPKARGYGELTPEEWIERKRLLGQAGHYFEKAAALDADYFPADLNRMCVMILEEAYTETVSFYLKKNFPARKGLPASSLEQVKLALGVAYALDPIPANKQKGRQIFQEIASSSSPLSAFAAANLERFDTPEKEIAPLSDSEVCNTPIDPSIRVDGIAINRISGVYEASLPLSGTFNVRIEYLSSSTLFRFFRKKEMALAFQLISIPNPSTQVRPQDYVQNKIVFTTSGFILHCEGEHAVFQADQQNRLIGWGKYYLY